MTPKTRDLIQPSEPKIKRGIEALIFALHVTQDEYATRDLALDKELSGDDWEKDSRRMCERFELLAEFANLYGERGLAIALSQIADRYK